MVETANTTDSASANTTDTGATEDAKGNDSKGFTQEQVDSIVADRLKRAAADSEKATRKAVAEALAEQERKSKLSEEQRLSEERKAKEDEIAQKERNITIRENRADAVEELAKQGIDTSLVDFVVDVNKDKTMANIKSLTKAFSSAVEKKVNEKLSGKTPTDYGDGSKDRTNGGKSDDTKVSKRGYRGTDGSITF